MGPANKISNDNVGFDNEKSFKPDPMSRKHKYY